MARQVSNVNILTDTWEILLLQSNELLNSLSNEIVTANSTYGVTGNTAIPRNTELVGQFGANTVIVTDALRGGNVVGGFTDLRVTTNVAISNAVTSNIHLRVGNTSTMSYINPVSVNLGNTISNSSLSTNTLVIQANSSANLNGTFDKLAIQANATVNAYVTATRMEIANTTAMAFATAQGFYAGNTNANASLTNTLLSVSTNTSISLAANSTSVSLIDGTSSSTVNTAVIQIANSSTSANVDPGNFKTGIFQANTTTVAIGANVVANSSALLVGNTTVNTVVTQTQTRIANTTQSTVIAAATGAFGNTTVNTNISSTLVEVANPTTSAVITPASVAIGNTSSIMAITSNVISTSTPLVVSNATSFSNTLNVTGAATLANTLTVTGLASLNSANIQFLAANSISGSVGQVLTSNATGGLYWSTISLNSVTTLTMSGNLTFGTASAIIANNSPGTLGQFLTSNGTALYWSSVAGATGGTVTSVGSGDGLTGGPVTTSGSLAVQAGSGIVANSSGVHVNASGITTGTVPSARLPSGSTVASGIVQLTDSVTSTSTTTAATPNSVKQAYDLAAAKGNGTVTSITAGTGLSGGTITGTGTIALGTIAGVVGSYTSGISAVTVDGNGRITSITGSANYLTSASSLNATNLTGTVAAARLGTGTPDSSNFLRGDGTWAIPAGAGGGTPGGATTQVQFNDGGVFNGTSGLAFNKATNVLTVGTSISIGAGTISATNYSGTAANATTLNGQADTYYLNATNLSSGTIPYARIPANVANTTGNFTISGQYTFSSATIFNNQVTLSSTLVAGASTGTSGQVLASTGTGVQWITPSGSGDITSVAVNSPLSGGGTAGDVTIGMSTSGVTSGSYTGGISALTVDSFGRITSLTGSAGYLNSGSNLNASNLSSGTVNVQRLAATSSSLSLLSAGNLTTGQWMTIGTGPGIAYTWNQPLSTLTFNLEATGAGAASYSTGISAISVDAYGRVTSVTGSAGYLTSASSLNATNLTGTVATARLGTGTASASNFLRGDGSWAAPTLTLTGTDVTTALGFTPYNSTNPSGYITSSALSPYLTSATASTTYQPLDGDLAAIAGLTGTAGLIRKTAADTYTLDTATYLTSASSLNATNLTGTVATARLGTGTASASNFLRGDGSWAVPAGGSGTVTAVTGTAPVVSSGGTAPAISMPAATATVDGYMTSTFAAKLNGIAAGATNVTNTNQLTNGAGFITGITSTSVTTALGFTPYNSTNPSGYITGITSTNVTTALGFTPYNSTNPSGYITASSSLNASNLTSGTVGTARLGTGSASSSTFLRGDGTWATPSGGSGTVTSVGITGTNITVGSSPITTSGSISISIPQSVATSATVQFAEVRSTGEVTAYYSSDRDLKENIRPIDNALGKLRQITGVMFDWSDEYIESRGGKDGFFVRKEDTGVIAQDVEKVLPEVVAKREDGTLGVKYEKMLGLVIQAINELAEEVEELKRK
jgi:hypothetical protein